MSSSLGVCYAHVTHHTVSGNGPLTNDVAHYIKQRQLLYYRDEFGDRGENVTVVFENSMLRNAYIALQALKQAILSDPQNLTANWVGSGVCNSLKNLAYSQICRFSHINSNKFCGTLPKKFKNLKICFELDISNNRFAGKFPYVVLSLPKLICLDIRFNEFEGTVNSKLFDKPLDAIFINHNIFVFELPDNFDNSLISEIVLANNKFHGCVPASLGNMSKLNEIILPIKITLMIL